MRPDSTGTGANRTLATRDIGIVRLRCDIVEGIIEYLRRRLQKTRVHLHSENAKSLIECSTDLKPAARDRNKAQSATPAPTDAASAAQPSV